MSEHTANLTKTLARRFFERISTKKRWNLQFCHFFTNNLSKTEVTQYFYLTYFLLHNKFYQEHFLMKNYKVDIIASNFVANNFLESRYVTV